MYFTAWEWKWKIVATKLLEEIVSNKGQKKRQKYQGKAGNFVPGRKGRVKLRYEISLSTHKTFKFNFYIFNECQNLYIWYNDIY